MLEVKGYKYLSSKIVPRPWGTELRFAMVDDVTGREFNEVIIVDNDKLSDEELSLLVESHLSKFSNVEVVTPIEPVVLDKKSVEKYLRDNLYIKEAQTIDDVKTEMAKAISAEPIEEAIRG